MNVLAENLEGNRSFQLLFEPHLEQSRSARLLQCNVPLPNYFLLQIDLSWKHKTIGGKEKNTLFLYSLKRCLS